MSFLQVIKDISRPVRMRIAKFKRENYEFNNLDEDQLRSVIRHEAHRIEKSYYNGIYFAKKKIYQEKADNIRSLIKRLSALKSIKTLPDVNWAKNIAENSEQLDNNFINKRSVKYYPAKMDEADIYNLFEQRRSAREWNTEQPDSFLLKELAARLVICGVNMPCSGNRQAIRFLILTEAEDKSYLKGIKEKHCYDAPMLIVVFSETKVYGSYGAFSKQEECILIDAAAAASAIVIAAELEGYSTCWNHFGLDLIKSRKTNRKIYSDFARRFSVSDTCRPVGIIAIGKEAYHAPKPERMPLEDFLI